MATFTASYSSSSASCSIVYSCETPVSGIDLCAAGTLNASSGEWQLTTADMSTYPPGAYSMEVSG